MATPPRPNPNKRRESVLSDKSVRDGEIERVVCWRMEQMLLAGATIPLAEAVAERPDIDLHYAVKVLTKLRATRPDAIRIARKILL